MKELLKLAGKTLTVLLTISLFVGTVSLVFNGNTVDKSLDFNVLNKIQNKIDGEVEVGTFLKKEQTDVLLRKVTEMVIRDGKLVPTILGLQRNMNRLHLTTEIGLLIDSNGGSIDLLKYLVGNLQRIKSLNVKFTCYIANAKSSAFTFVQSICDDRILLKNGELMQHEAYFPTSLKGKYKDSSTKLLSIAMAKAEADRIGMKLSEWYKISRENGDKFFTEEEAKKYKLIDSVLE